MVVFGNLNNENLQSKYPPVQNVSLTYNECFERYPHINLASFWVEGTCPMPVICLCYCSQSKYVRLPKLFSLFLTPN